LEFFDVMGLIVPEGIHSLHDGRLNANAIFDVSHRLFVLTNSAFVKAIAFKSGYNPTAQASANSTVIKSFNVS
jgi:hypothetical protein